MAGEVGGLRLLVCGGRGYANRSALFAALDRVEQFRGVAVVISGGATGADALAAEWADSRHVPKIVEPAEWKKYGKAAGPIRNQKMIDKHQPTGVVAFPGGNGTRDMISRAEAAGIPVYEPFRVRA